MLLAVVICPALELLVSIRTAAAIWPKTFTQLRIISGMRSMPRMSANPAVGTPMAARAGAIVTTLEDGTGATVSETRNVAKITAPAAPSANGTP